MSNFNNSILIQNIKLQMKKHNENQKQLADAIGMSQPNFNKAINEKDGKLFTLQQLFDISQHYGVSIDSLLGNEPVEDMSLASICSFIKELIEMSYVDVVETDYQDFTYSTEHIDYYDQEEVTSSSITSSYPTLVFPNRLFQEKYLSGWDSENKKLEYARKGNMNFSNKTINNFIRKYLRMYHLYLKNEIDRDVLDLAYDHYLQEVIDSETPFY